MSYWPFTMRRDTKKDEQITKLQADVESKDLLIAALKADKMRLEADNVKWIGHITLLEQEGTERFETITGLRKNVSAGIERIRELEAESKTRGELALDVTMQLEEKIIALGKAERDAAEHAIASARYVKDIADLNGECLALAAENSDLLAFVRKASTGANIRTDKPGGRILVEHAKAILERYDSQEEKQ